MPHLRPSHPLDPQPASRRTHPALLGLLLLGALLLPSCQDRESADASDEQPPAEQPAGDPAPPAATPPAPEPPAAEDDALPEEATLKELLTEAASMDKELWKNVLSDPSTAREDILAAQGETLTVHLLLTTDRPKADPSTPGSFQIDAQVDPAKLAAAINPSAPRSQHVSVLQSRYITDLTVEQEDGRMTGSVTFAATNGSYHGTLGFEGSPDPAHPTGWQITSFLFPSENYRLARQDDGTWSRVDP